jgi:hypothetical protein
MKYRENTARHSQAPPTGLHSNDFQLPVSVLFVFGNRDFLSGANTLLTSHYDSFASLQATFDHSHFFQERPQRHSTVLHFIFGI